MTDYHDLEKRETLVAQARLVCYCGFATAWSDATATRTATLVAAVEFAGHLRTAQAETIQANYPGAPT